jgi:hypothetical protein
LTIFQKLSLFFPFFPLYNAGRTNFASPSSKVAPPSYPTRKGRDENVLMTYDTPAVHNLQHHAGIGARPALRILGIGGGVFPSENVVAGMIIGIAHLHLFQKLLEHYGVREAVFFVGAHHSHLLVGHHHRLEVAGNFRSQFWYPMKLEAPVIGAFVGIFGYYYFKSKRKEAIVYKRRRDGGTPK